MSCRFDLTCNGVFARLVTVEAESVPLGVLGNFVTGVKRGRRERDGYRLVECEQKVALHARGMVE